jgi:DNA polymerase V
LKERGRGARLSPNNFYVSYERIFNPRLAGKTFVVLYDNDYSAVARTAEVKALGVKMGTRWFQLRALAELSDGRYRVCAS